MGQRLGELYAELALKTDKLQKGISESNRSLAKLEQDIDKTVESINAKLESIGKALSVGVTLPLTLLGKAALDTFTNFEQSMQNTFSVMGASASEMEALRKKAEEMGATTRFSASQAADALYSLGSAGQSATQAMNSLDGVLQLAGATGSDLAFTSSTIASTLSQFNLQAEKSGHIADVFSLAISKSQANMTKLSYSMKYVGPVAAGLGVSLETSTAALMRLYNTGFGGEQAGTILRSGLQKLASDTDDVKKKLQELGVSYDEVNPKTNNLADIIERLKNANIDDIYCNVAAPKRGKVIFLNEEQCGSGPIGKSLLAKFLGAALSLDEKPVKVICVNNAVRITTNRGHECFEAIKKLNEAGAEILSCGSCLEGYKLVDKLAIGEISNAYEIMDVLSKYEVIKL